MSVNFYGNCLYTNSNFNISFYDFLGKSDSVLQMQQNEDKEYIEMDINTEMDVNTENKISNKG